MHLNKRLSKQSWGWRFETPSRPLWRHCNVNDYQNAFLIAMKGREKCNWCLPKHNNKILAVYNDGNSRDRLYVMITPMALTQDCSDSIANALELLQSCTKPSTYCCKISYVVRLLMTKLRPRSVNVESTSLLFKRRRKKSTNVDPRTSSSPTCIFNAIVSCWKIAESPYL